MNERRLFGRQRRANADAPRERRYTVKVTAVEDAALRGKAAQEKVTVPRLLFESAMNARVETSTRRKDAIAELFAIRRLMANVANNVNQVAKFANTESAFPAEAEDLVAEYRALVGRMSEALEKL